MKPKKLFVIQPFKENHSDAFFDQIRFTCSAFKNEFKVCRADTEPSESGPMLQFRIIEYLKKADICVADISTGNHNVWYEVGVAFALDIPVILVSSKNITEGKTMKEKIPSDISNNLFICCEFDKLSTETKVQQAFREELKGRLEELKSTKLAQKPEFIVKGYKNRKQIDFSDLITRCQKRIWILTTNVDFIVNEPLQCGLCSEKRTVLDMIYNELKLKPSDFSIRILTLDPDSNYTNDRASSLLTDKIKFRENMREELKKIKSFVEENCTLFAEVRTYDAYPLQMTYFFDEYVVSSVVNSSSKSRDCITYLHSLKELGAVETYEKHFELLWSSGKEYARKDVKKPKFDKWKPNSVYYDSDSLQEFNSTEILVDNYKKELEREKLNAEIKFNCGLKHFENQEYENAIKCFEEVYKINKEIDLKEEKEYKNISDQKKDNINQTYFEKINFKETCYYLGMCYNKLAIKKDKIFFATQDGNLQKSLERLLEAEFKYIINEKDENFSKQLLKIEAYVYFTKGLIYYKKKSFDKAIQFLNLKSSNSEFLSLEINFYLGMCYLGMCNKEEVWDLSLYKDNIDNIEKALIYLRETKKLREENRHKKPDSGKEFENEISNFLSKIYFSKGLYAYDKEDFENAKLYFEKIYKDDLRDVCFYLGMCSLNDSVSKYYKEAKEAKKLIGRKDIPLDELERRLDQLEKLKKPVG